MVPSESCPETPLVAMKVLTTGSFLGIPLTARRISSAISWGLSASGGMKMTMRLSTSWLSDIVWIARAKSAGVAAPLMSTGFFVPAMGRRNFLSRD